MTELALDAHGNVYADGVRTETLREPATRHAVSAAFMLCELAAEDLAACFADCAERTGSLYAGRGK